MGFVFLGLLLIWFAIFCLDFCYYNKLLQGAVRAIIALEHKTEKSKGHTIDLSTTVENTFRCNKKFSTSGEESTASKDNKVTRSFGGVIAFYCIVGGVLAALSGFFFYQAP